MLPPLAFLSPLRSDFNNNVLKTMTENKRIYISGAIYDNPGYRSQFAAEAERLREQGHFVINPAELDLDEGATWIDYMKSNLIQMLSATTRIHFLPGYENSTGAMLEKRVAETLGYEITFAEGA